MAEIVLLAMDVKDRVDEFQDVAKKKMDLTKQDEINPKDPRVQPIEFSVSFRILNFAELSKCARVKLKWWDLLRFEFCTFKYRFHIRSRSLYYCFPDK
jgi:hypothetical protein